MQHKNILVNYLDDVMNTEEKKRYVHKVIALSKHSKEDFAKKHLNLSEKELNKQLENGAFSNAHLQTVITYAKNRDIWDEFGFKYTTSDIGDALNAIVAFSDFSLTKISHTCDIPYQRLLRYTSGKRSAIETEDFEKLLRFAKLNRLSIIVTY